MILLRPPFGSSDLVYLKSAFLSFVEMLKSGSSYLVLFIWCVEACCVCVWEIC